MNHGFSKGIENDRPKSIRPSTRWNVDARNGWLEVNRETFTLSRLPARFDALTLAHISDFHYGTWLNRARAGHAIDQVNAADPDVVVITGDLVNHAPDRHSDELIPLLRGLSPSIATYSVLGNHDYKCGAEKIVSILENAGIVPLRNQVEVLRRGPDALYLAGVDCAYCGMDRLEDVVERLPESAASILMVHEPDLADRAAASGRFDLQLSGHSHGGQMVFPWIGRPYLPRLAWKYPVGRYRVGGMHLYTNRGLGTSHLQFRINCPAEIAVITLRASSKQA